MKFNNIRLLVRGYRKCFEVTSVDETYAELRAKGVSFINEPTDMPG